MRTTSLLICVGVVALVSSHHHKKKKHPFLFHGGLLGGGFKPYALPFSGLPTGFQGLLQKVPDQPVAGGADAVAIGPASPISQTPNVAQVDPQNLPGYSEAIDSLLAGSIPYQVYEEAGEGRQGQVQFGAGSKQGVPIPIALTFAGFNPTESKLEQQPNPEKTPAPAAAPEENKDNKPEKQQIIVIPQGQGPDQLGLRQLLQQLGQVVMVLPSELPVQPVQQNFLPGQQQQQQDFGSKQPYQPQGFYGPGAFLPGNYPYFGSNVYLQPQPIQGEEELPLAHSASPSTNGNLAQAFVVQPLKRREQKPATKNKKGREDSDPEQSPSLV